MTESHERSIIMVSGSPASGKSTLARALAKIFGYALLSKDTFKESLFDSLGARLGSKVASPAELSRLLSRTAMDLLWSVAPCCPEVILEANFRPRNEYERERFAALQGRKLEVYCRCSPQEAQRRFRERATWADHHRAHSMKMLSAELVAEFDRPVGMCPVIEVDTERPVDAEEIAEHIRRHWPDLPK